MLIKLQQPVAAAADKEPPKEFRIFSFGENKSLKGDFLFDEKAAQDVLAAYKEHGAELALDYEHASLEDPAPPAGAPAAGWYGLELRQDGLWAVNVRWTPRATEYLKNSEYRYVSPAFTADTKTKRVKRLLNVALTNLPAMDDLEPLVAAKAEPQPHSGREAARGAPMETLLKMLGLQDTATEAEAVSALNARDTARKELEGDVLALTGAKTLSEAKGQLAALKTKADERDAAVTEMEKLKAAALEREVTELVDGAVRDGKVPPALKAFWFEQGKKDLAMLKAFIEKAPKLIETKATKPAKDAEDDDGDELTATELRVAEQLGMKPEDFLKRKKAAKAKAKRAQAAE